MSLNILTELTVVIQENIKAVVISTIRNHFANHFSHDLLATNIKKAVIARVSDSKIPKIRCQIEFVDFLGDKETLVIYVDFTKSKRAALLCLKIRTDFSQAAKINWYEQYLS